MYASANFRFPRAASSPPSAREPAIGRTTLPALAAALLIGLASGAACAAQAQAPAPAPPASVAPKAVAASIPLAEVLQRAEEDDAKVREIRDSLRTDRTDQAITAELAPFSREIEVRAAEQRRILARTSSLETLRRIEAPWARFQHTLEDWSRSLSQRIARAERGLQRLDQLRATWAATEQQAKTAAAPPEVLARLQRLLADIADADDVLEREHARALSVQTRVAVQQARVADIADATRRVRQDVEENLLVRDGPALWELSAAEARVAEEGQSSLGAQWIAVRAYSERHAGSFALHGALFAALAALLVWTRRRLRPWIAEEPALAESAAVFGTPIAMALLLSIMGGVRIYPDAPTLWLAILGALGLIPAIVILRRLMDRDVRPVMYVLVAFYLIDRVRTVAAPLAVVPRLLFLGEVLCAAAVSAWLAFALRRSLQRDSLRRRTYVRRLSAAALLVALSAALTNALGYIALSSLLGNALFSAAYAGLMLYAIVEILDGLIAIALHSRPAVLLASVRQHRQLIGARLRRALEGVAVLLWLAFVLQRLALRERLFSLAGDALSAQLAVGSIRVSLGDLLAFVIAVWAAFLVSRLARFLMEEEIFPRFNLSRGLPYAISATVHYAVLTVGFFIAVGALGLDMTKFTILAGAFTVGVGFGLQNIFNNFVSGLILLYERPIKVGDLVQIGDEHGLVERIGIRASIVRSSSGAQLIVPNGKLISDQVVNWTLYYRRCSVEIPIAVASVTDTGKALEILERVARENRLVLKEPAPKALVSRTGPDWWNLVLRVWTEHPEQWMDVRSELAVAAARALQAGGVAMK